MKRLYFLLSFVVITISVNATSDISFGLTDIVKTDDSLKVSFNVFMEKDIDLYVLQGYDKNIGKWENLGIIKSNGDNKDYNVRKNWYYISIPYSSLPAHISIGVLGLLFFRKKSKWLGLLMLCIFIISCTKTIFTKTVLETTIKDFRIKAIPKDKTDGVVGYAYFSIQN